jgi:aromatic-L-amino-acid decarboxylase
MITPTSSPDLPGDDFRRLGHELIDWVSDFLARGEEIPVFPQTRPGEIRQQLPAAPPENGESLDNFLADVERIIMPGMAHWNHPRCFAYFNSSGSGPGILGEILATAFNVNSMLWHSCPAATELEEHTLDWLRQMLGLPAEFRGIIYEGGSTSTFHALAAARESLADLEIRERGLTGRGEVPLLRIYASEQAHSSVEKAAIALGMGLASIRKIAVDREYQMQPDALAAAITEDRQAGIRPCAVVATIGTTSCTSIDPVAKIAEICQRENLWLHVDAAHGGAAAVTPELKWVLDGCAAADSIVVNPHKWLFVPLDLSVLYVRRPEVLRQAFSLVPEYLRTTAGDDVTNYMDYGIPLGRRFRALKLWLVLRYFGREGLASRIREHVRLAQLFAGWVDTAAQFERLAPVPLSTVCYRAHPPQMAGLNDESALDQLNERLLAAINNSGRAFLSHTRLDGKYVLRMVISHLRTEERHVREAWELAQECLRKLDTL